MSSKFLNSHLPNTQIVNGFQMHTNQSVTLNVNTFQVIGQGTFGYIEKANVRTTKSDSNDNESAKSVKFVGAIKKVHQDPRYKNRELNIIQRIKSHPNIVDFKYYFYSMINNENSNSSNQMSKKQSSGDIYLHLVMECFPESLSDLIVRYHHNGMILSMLHVKIHTYQMLRALGYLHSFNICHRDIKSSNLLVNESSLTLKLCDFGSAKELIAGTTSVSYISSRYYRAPELLFGAQHYTTAIDVWSAGCVLGEMLRMGCLFTGSDAVDQLVKVIRVLGSPSADDVIAMNPSCPPMSLPHVLPCPIKLFFPHNSQPDLLELLTSMLIYNPIKRSHPTRLLLHRCFDELRNLRDIPSLFSFLPEELSVLDSIEQKRLIEMVM
uniref:Glycogen synthase kinase 3 n=1 Tax=Schmidtea mediterranea TaxID=79327 RepID=Q1WBW1_SCHMD|nr:glycogen synthase kinase 3 [Schmidtea mediterranea]